MTLGTGVIQGVAVDQVVGIRPGDLAYEAHSGAVFHGQDESQGGNVPFYEIQATGDQIDINLGNIIFEMEDPALVFYTKWGETDFDVVERSEGTTIVSEQSGFDSDVWVVDAAATDGQLRITNFDTADGVDGTQAGWLPYIGVHDLVS